jgi:two-component system LytT family response regulator
MTFTKIKALIVDDESLARDRIRELLREIPEINITEECANGLQAVKAILEKEPDLVFLDIQMPGMDGFEVIRTIGVENMPAIIFVTAYDQYAVKAFESHAFDYLLKPFNSKRLLHAVERVMPLIHHHPNLEFRKRVDDLLEQMKQKDNFIERILIKATNRIYFIRVGEMDWIESAGNYVEIHTGKETHLLRETMNNLETKLNPSKFLRIHRSVIVNIDQIKEMQPDVDNNYIVILKCGKQLTMSRGQREKMKKLMGIYL